MRQISCATNTLVRRHNRAACNTQRPVLYITTFIDCDQIYDADVFFDHSVFDRLLAWCGQASKHAYIAPRVTGQRIRPSFEPKDEVWYVFASASRAFTVGAGDTKHILVEANTGCLSRLWPAMHVALNAL